MKRLPVLGLVLLLAACSESRVRVTERMQPATSAAVYFPNDSSVRKNLASGVLFAMKEPSLAGYNGNGDFVRLTWLPAVANLTVIRLNKFNDVVYANRKEMRPDGVIVADTLIVLRDTRWKEVADQLSQAIPPQSRGLEGITWYLESRVGGQYRLQQGWDEGNVPSPIFESILKIR
ncbi:hypothetical protein MKQ70_10880 [Chitinophaga sedimenti]|uniref:hypothetical protein n=1 Tax=Chitinophaga sedimenti TaxID=2033606 RepID=UPI002006C949|nr:hypothetical protein [Chitinophaga sedimenti]MCK7555483.1 hypothetical protein [Chitinophaga sedimenti]